MTPFRKITSTVLPMLEDRVDTDVIYPARFLLLMQRAGLGDCLCRDRRFTPDGEAIPGSIFDDPARAGSAILLAGEDFGCGSSREQAVWALDDFGVRCVIGVSFGEIFAANALRNGMLTLTMDRELIEQFAHAESMTVDLEEQELVVGDTRYPFSIPPAARARLLDGLDEIDVILRRDRDAIVDFETQQQRVQPWLYQDQK